MIWGRSSSMISYPLHNHRKDFYMSKNLLKYTLLVLGLAFGTCSSAYGMAFFKTPEVDPTLAISAITLLAGSLAVLRSHRQK
jgi:hypothetical protein